MNYPEHIYNDFEIVKKEIYGQKHYGLVKHYKFLGMKISRQQKIDNVWGDGRIRSYGNRWVPSESLVKSAIIDDNQRQESKFRQKVRK